jgi:beta-lactamase superfamily II metal-dependent hydrolase
MQFYQTVLEEKGCEIHYTTRSTVLTDEEGTYTLRCLYPYTLEAEEDLSDWAMPVSSVMWLSYKGVDALFMGDADHAVEEMLLSDAQNGLLPGVDLTSTDILKVGHHGSKSSTSAAFVDYIHPQMAVISCGENNDGHPTQEVLSILSTHAVKTFRTDAHGTAIITVPTEEGFGLDFVE